MCAPAPEAANEVRRAWDRHVAVLLVDPDAPAPEARRQLAALAPDEPVDPEVAAIVATSGTAGEPRGVELTFDGLRASADAVNVALGTADDDRWLCCLPIHRVAGLAVLARSWISGVPVTVLPRFDVEGFEGAASSATLVSLVPTMARRLLDAGVDLPGRFRHVLVGGGPVPVGLPGTPTYGLTETWGGVAHDGRPLAGVELTLGDEEEVLVRGPMVMRGYRNDKAGTAAAFTSDGRLRTGDAGRIGAGGRLEVVDRLRDLVITGGVNVSPTEVEAVLAQHPDVADVGVAGTPDPEWGERVVAFVVAADPLSAPTLEALRGFAADRLTPAKLPRQLVLVESLPRGPGGKLARRLLSVASAEP